MRVLVNFQQNDGWWVHCIAEDARTPISPYVSVKEEATLIHLLRYVGATDAEIEEVQKCIRRWGRGSVRIDLSPGCKNLLCIRAPWSEQLRLY
jgi:hypothetical protein